MRLWLIQTGEPLPLDPSVRRMRTAMLAFELARRGHDVLWWTSAFDHFTKSWLAGHAEERLIEEHASGGRLRIKFIRGLGYKSNVSLGRFRDHRKVAQGFASLALEERHGPDAMVVSLPPHDVASGAVEFANTRGIPVIVDVRDPWPDVFADHAPGMLRPLVRLLLSPDYRMSRRAIGGADVLVSVSDELMRWARERGGRRIESRDMVLPIGYLKNPQAPAGLIDKTVAGLKGKFVVFFVGTISAGYHDPSILVDAARQLSAREDIHFVIAGDGGLLPELKAKASSLKNVSLPGWIDYETTGAYLSIAGAGVCPATRAVSLPTNKAYAYLSAGLPVLTSFSGEFLAAVEEYGAGWYCPPGDLKALTAAVEKLAHEPAVRAKASSAALRLFEDRYDAKAIYARYAGIVESLGARR